MTDDRFDLDRFVAAQAPVYAAALDELKAGRKRSHWMWFVFPQLRGLGSSPMARRYAIASLGEATDYLRHPLLGSRLRTCTQAVLALDARTPHEIFGSPDDLKFCSSMTLFAAAAGDREGTFHDALDRCCGGRRDERTLALLRS